jgi:putative transposase
MDEHAVRITRTRGMTPRRAGCGESRTSGSEGGPGNPTSRETGRAPRSDPYTYIPTWEGFLFLAVVLDVWSRRIVGWAMAAHLRTELVLQALDMAIARRRPNGVIHHSDRGCQYTSVAFGRRCREAGIRPSMGSVGDCFDNALCEAFFATLECELIDRRTFQTRPEARREVFEFIEGWYNSRRRHSALGQLSPIEFERSASAAEHEVVK